MFQYIFTASQKLFPSVVDILFGYISQELICAVELREPLILNREIKLVKLDFFGRILVMTEIVKIQESMSLLNKPEYSLEFSSIYSYIQCTFCLNILALLINFSSVFDQVSLIRFEYP